MLSRLLLARSIRNHANEDSGDPYWDNVVALLGLEGADGSLLLKDSVSRVTAIDWTVSTGAAASTTKYKFGGSSYYFDGVNGSIQTGITTDNVFAEDFSVEGWANADDLTQSRCILDTRVAVGSSRAFAVAVQPDGKVYVYTAIDNVVHVGAISVSPNTWFHWEVSRQAGVLRLFVNGGLALSVPNTTIFDIGRIMLGRSVDASGYRWKGYIQEFKCTQYSAGHVAAFTPPTQPYDQIDTTVSHLLHLNGVTGSTVVVNEAVSFKPAWQPRITGPRLSSAAAKFGLTSARLAGSMCMAQSAGAQYEMGSGDFTWELFFRYDSLSAYQTLICNRVDSGSHADQITVGIENNGKVYIYSNTMLVEIASGIAANTWAHIAVSVQATVGRLFVNGVQVGSNFTCPTLANTGISVGANMDRTESLLGYIDSVRITKGVARYTSNFTPPTAPFPNYSMYRYYSEVKKDTPLAYFRLDELQDTTAANSGTSTINGVYTGGYILGQNSLCGDIGDHAVLFDGTSGYVTIGSVSDFNLNSNFTFEAIITTPTAASTMAILSHGYLGAMLRLNASKLNLVKSYSLDRGSSNVVLQADTKYIVGVTVTASGVSTFYVNGVAAGNGVTAADYGSPTQTLKIGVDTSSSGVRTNYWNGVIDEVAIYPTALTATRMLAHAQAAGLA